MVWWEEVFALSATRLHSLSMGSGTTFPGPSLWFFPSGGRLRGKFGSPALSALRARRASDCFPLVPALLSRTERFSVLVCYLATATMRMY